MIYWGKVFDSPMAYRRLHGQDKVLTYLRALS